jgi:hypothetical protein
MGLKLNTFQKVGYVWKATSHGEYVYLIIKYEMIINTNEVFYVKFWTIENI